MNSKIQSESIINSNLNVNDIFINDMIQIQDNPKPKFNSKSNQSQILQPHQIFR